MTTSKNLTLKLDPFEAELLYVALATFVPTVSHNKRQQLKRDELIAELHEYVMEDES